MKRFLCDVVYIIAINNSNCSNVFGVLYWINTLGPIIKSMTGAREAEWGPGFNCLYFKTKKEVSYSASVWRPVHGQWFVCVHIIYKNKNILLL